MKLHLLFGALLALSFTSCQKGDTAQESSLLERVISSPEYVEMLSVLDNKRLRIEEERAELRSTFEAASADLSEPEQQELWKKMNDDRRKEMQERIASMERINECHLQLVSIIQENPGMTEAEIVQERNKIDQQMGISPEMRANAEAIVASSPMIKATKKLEEKFPELKEQDPTFLETCFNAYLEKHGFQNQNIVD
ncbi:MAG TPA: hypothetical protein PKA00_17005 [Saprospiraceae bacterium]|nr:hypothetical protein [Saprospiraceae bacterium]HMQ84618.1 hypothetical protein [Saprospiraceae bacterium]